MAAVLDLDGYFARIQWGGETSPTYDTLAGLLHAHMSHIPFENLDVLLGRPVRLDLDGLQSKLVGARRGGYCFEHGTLLAAVMEKLGFRIFRHTARVVLVASRTASPRTHMFLKVSLPTDSFILDPGFGGLAPRFPVPLVDATASNKGALTHWMVQDGPYWVLKARSGDKVVDAWVSTLDCDNEVDFEVGNYYTSTFPASQFVNRIMMRALTPTGRVTVADRNLTIWNGNESHSTQIVDRHALRALLIEHFGFDLPEVESLRVPSIPEWS